MTCEVNWAGFIGSPSEWVERCCDVHVHHVEAHQAAGCWTLGLGQRPACSAKHQQVFSKHWECGKEDQKWVYSILATWFLSGQEFYVLWYRQGSSIRAQATFFSNIHMYFYVHVNAHKKYAYKQLINRSRNVICGLFPFFVPFHFPRRWGTHISWNCPWIYELMSLPTANVFLHHTQRFQGVRSPTGSAS